MTQSSFELAGDVNFAPFYVPNRFRIKKSRNLDRQENFCGREDVTDLGAKNREVHISGYMREPEIAAFTDIIDASVSLNLVTPGWVGEIRVSDGEYEGPNLIDPHTGDDLYKYTLDLVSTGKDENQSTPGEESEEDLEPQKDPAKDITFEEVFTRAGVNPTDDQIAAIKDDAYYAYYIANRNAVEYGRLIGIDLNTARDMILAAEELVTETRERAGYEK